MEGYEKHELNKICEELASVSKKVGSVYKHPSSDECYQLSLEIMMLESRIDSIANGSIKNRA